MGPMQPKYVLSRSTRALRSGSLAFDAWALRWAPADGGTAADAREVTAREAVRWLTAEGGARRLPVGVIGPKVATPRQVAVAEELGRLLGEVGLTVLCGGKSGVMEGVCKGNLAAGGLPIGMLPDDDWTLANPYVAIPLATGIGVARNAVIARAAFAMIAVGGEFGTLTEMAYGRHFDKLVVGLEGAPQVPGAVYCDTVGEAVDLVCADLLRLPA